MLNRPRNDPEAALTISFADWFTPGTDTNTPHGKPRAENQESGGFAGKLWNLGDLAMLDAMSLLSAKVSATDELIYSALVAFREPPLH